MNAKQLHLFPPGNPRPEEKSAVAETAKLVAPEVAKWLEQGGECSIDMEELEEQVCYVIFDGLPELDAYNMAKEFESKYGYDPDKAFVDILDDIELVLGNVHDNLVAEWMRINEIKPKFNIGDKVVFSRKENFKKKMFNGEIVSIDMKRGKYTIFCEELGHVRNGVGTHGVIKTFEEVEQDSLKENAVA